MKNCKQTFASDVRKCGYLKVGRSLLKTLFQGNMEERQLAGILLCVQTFAYFSEGQVCTDEGVYICRPGEWVATYLEISTLARVERHQVKNRLTKLEMMHLLTIENIGSYKRITLTNYDQQMQTSRTSSPAAQATSAEDGCTGDSLFASAGNFYAPSGGPKGGTGR